MISFQQLLDTTRANSEICCPGYNYWINGTASRNHYTAKTVGPACIPVAGYQICLTQAGGTQNFVHEAVDHGSGGLHPFAPNMKIDPETGNYHFYVGSQLNEPPYMMNESNNAYRFRAEFDRNGNRVSSQNSVSLGTLCDNSTDSEGTRITRWHCYNTYSDAMGTMYHDTGNVGMVWPCAISPVTTLYHLNACGGRWTYRSGLNPSLLQSSIDDYGMCANWYICDFCGAGSALDGNYTTLCGSQGACAPSSCNVKCCTQRLKIWSEAYDSHYLACGDIPGISFLGHEACCNYCRTSISCSECWTPFCGFFACGLTGPNSCGQQNCGRGFIWETGGINYTGDHGKTAIFKYGERYAHHAYCCCQCSTPGCARCTAAPYCLCNNSTPGCCTCAWADYKLYVVANEYHPQEEYWTVLCCCQTHTCKSVWALNIPTGGKMFHHPSQNCYPTLMRCNNNAYLESEFFQTQTIARKTPDVDPNPSSYYVGIVSNRWTRCSGVSGNLGTTPTLAIIPPECTIAGGGLCPNWHAPHGVVWEQNLPTWDGTLTGGCHEWAGKTWYFNHACFAIENVCGELQEHYSIKDMEFRGNKIILKPNQDIMFQPDCEFCNGNVIQPSVYFCQNNCDVTHIFFCDQYKGTKVNSSLSFTKRGTWLVATPNTNPWFNCCVPGSNCVCSNQYNPAYEGITLSEWSEDWSTCYGAVGICISTIFSAPGPACCLYGGMFTTNTTNKCYFGKNSVHQSAIMRDWEMNYDYFTDDVVLAFTIPGSKNHYNANLAFCYCLYGSKNHGGVNVMKLPANIATVCDWACEQLKIRPGNGNCLICGGKACDGCFYCLWRCAYPQATVTGNGYSTACVCPGGINARQHIRINCGETDAWANLFTFIEPVAPPLACYKTIQMESCTINPCTWMRGCLSPQFIANSNFCNGCAFNMLHKIDCSGTHDWAETWITCMCTAGCLNCYGTGTGCQDRYSIRQVCHSGPRGAGWDWQSGKRPTDGFNCSDCAWASAQTHTSGYQCITATSCNLNGLTTGIHFHSPPRPIYICEC